LIGDEEEQHESEQGGLDGRWRWPTSGSWAWLAYRLFNPALDPIHFAMEDAKQQLAALERYSATSERPDRRDFSMERRTASRPWFEGERRSIETSLAAREQKGAATQGPRPSD
jgi:hypothetical protein